MNLETSLPSGLLEAVRVNYEKRDFTAAVLDCCYFLSELLRQKSGADGDGIPLIGQALGGTSPKIRVAKDQSETEQNVQKGIESILRGFYQAIRNPRSHNKMLDSAEDGTSIIMFCGFLVRQLEKAKALASKDELIKRALDKDFVPNDRYAELFMAELPLRLRLEVFFGVYNKRKEWNVKSIYFFNKSLLSNLIPSDRVLVAGTISDDLKSTDDDVVIRHVLSGTPAELWLEIADIARLRIENKIILSIRDGKYDSRAFRCLAGSLATWGRAQFPYFLLKDELIRAVAVKLESRDSQELSYVLTYLTDKIFNSFTAADLRPIHRVFIRKLKAGNQTFYNDLIFISQANWSPELTTTFESFKEKPEITLDDEIPF